MISGTNVTWNRSINGYCLPAEAEWEYACRAGTTTSYSSGSSVDNADWYSSNSGSKTHPVGTKQANARGLYDCTVILGKKKHLNACRASVRRYRLRVPVLLC
ncbi:SUMF1/EgtB/PvdO family nonheme iron enzyme [Breznakiellaceae bacterium SP9]